MFFNKNCCFQNNFNMCDPIIEKPITRVIEKEFYHEVPHCCPMHTHIVNKHIYNHTYKPEYSCDEENVIINNDCGGCSANMFNDNF